MTLAPPLDFSLLRQLLKVVVKDERHSEQEEISSVIRLLKRGSRILPCILFFLYVITLSVELINDVITL